MGGECGARVVAGPRGPTRALAVPSQQFLDDPKYSSDEDLSSKLEAFKREGKILGVVKGEERISP